MARTAATAVLTALALVGCKGDFNVSDTKPVVTLAPSLLDFQTVSVGASIQLPISVINSGPGTAEISAVIVTNIDGSYFSFDGQTTFPVDNGESFDLPITYTPLDEGWHRATVEVVSNATEAKLTLDVRGHAVIPDATLTPLGLDFGPVAVGDSAQQTVLLTNAGDVDLQVDDARFSVADFSLGDPLPIAVAAGDDQTITVVFTPTTDFPSVGNMTLKIGDIALPIVQVRGNDCENGIPAMYDQDGDGVTLCAGDCDDSDRGVHPGATELLDAVDQDCDGKIDEGTTGADDDGDGYCDDPTACTDGSLPGDCADGDAAVSPDATEDFTNGIDDDCDGVVDYGTSDADGDGYAPDGGDCDDADPTRAPGFTEIADNIDNDCDGTVDEGTSAHDDDGDGFCESACTDGTTAGDCDDGQIGIHPGGSEGVVGDFRDNDCDGIVDEGTDHYDDDGDGFTEVGGDCDDGDATVNPALGGC